MRLSCAAQPVHGCGAAQIGRQALLCRWAAWFALPLIIGSVAAAVLKHPAILVRPLSLLFAVEFAKLTVVADDAYKAREVSDETPVRPSASRICHPRHTLHSPADIVPMRTSALIVGVACRRDSLPQGHEALPHVPTVAMWLCRHFARLTAPSFTAVLTEGWS